MKTILKRLVKIIIIIIHSFNRLFFVRICYESGISEMTLRHVVSLLSHDPITNQMQSQSRVPTASCTLLAVTE